MNDENEVPTLNEKLFAPFALIKTGMPRQMGEAAPSFEEPRFNELKSDIKFYSFFMFTVPFITFFFIQSKYILRLIIYFTDNYYEQLKPDQDLYAGLGAAVAT